MSSTEKTCSFCRNKGIASPHNHTIRDFGKKGSPITCPELLNIECSYCKEKGHTVSYCSVLKEKKMVRNIPVIAKNVNKRTITDSDGFITPNRAEKCSDNKYCAQKIQKIGMLASMFGALEVEEIPESKSDNGSWADRVSRQSNANLCRDKLREQIGITKTEYWGDLEDN